MRTVSSTPLQQFLRHGSMGGPTQVQLVLGQIADSSYTLVESFVTYKHTHLRIQSHQVFARTRRIWNFPFLRAEPAKIPPSFCRAIRNRFPFFFAGRNYSFLLRRTSTPASSRSLLLFLRFALTLHRRHPSPPPPERAWSGGSVRRHRGRTA